jgi:hypothetical protein
MATPFSLANLTSGKLNSNYTPPAAKSAPKGTSGLGPGFDQLLAIGRANNPDAATRGPDFRSFGLNKDGSPINTGGGGGGGSLSGSATISPNPNGGGKTFEDKSDDISVQNAGLGAVDGQTAAGIAAIDKALGSLKGQYGEETKANETNYKNESDSNQNALQGGKQTSLVRAGQGRQGLLGTLSALGALSGDSIELANRAVQNGANEDLAGVSHTFATNQSGLDTAIGTYRRQDKARNDEADTAAGNAKTNANTQALQTKQSFLSNLQRDYTAEGNSEQAKSYADQVAALYPQIAAGNVPNANLVAQTAAYTPSTLASYLNNSNTAVTATPNEGNGPSNLPTLSAVNPLRKQTTPVAA